MARTVVVACGAGDGVAVGLLAGLGLRIHALAQRASANIAGALPTAIRTLLSDPPLSEMDLRQTLVAKAVSGCFRGEAGKRGEQLTCSMWCSCVDIGHGAAEWIDGRIQWSNTLELGTTTLNTPAVAPPGRGRRRRAVRLWTLRPFTPGLCVG